MWLFIHELFIATDQCLWITVHSRARMNFVTSCQNNACWAHPECWSGLPCYSPRLASSEVYTWDDIQSFNVCYFRKYFGVFHWTSFSVWSNNTTGQPSLFLVHLLCWCHIFSYFLSLLRDSNDLYVQFEKIWHLSAVRLNQAQFVFFVPNLVNLWYGFW